MKSRPNVGPLSFFLLCLSILIVFTLSISNVNAIQYSVCNVGCNFSNYNITSAVQNVTGTSNTIIINESGTYTITNIGGYYINDSTSNGAILINASDVYFNCNFADIIGYNKNGLGIYATQNNITVTNCAIRNFSINIFYQGSANSKITSNLLSNSNYGIRLSNSNYTWIDKNTINSGTTSAVHLINGAINNTIHNSIINNSLQDISSSGIGTTNQILNSSFNITNLAFADNSELFVNWYIDVFVNDTNGNPVNNSIVNITDKYSTLIYSLITDVTGYTEQKNISTYKINNSGYDSFSNFTIYTYNGTSFAQISYNISNTDTIELTFDITAPVISGITNSTTNESISISWSTDDLSNSTVIWGNQSNNLLNTAINNSLIKSHQVLITALTSNTTYYYNLSSCNNQGLCSETGPYSLTTNITLDITAPVINLLSEVTTNQTTDITFNTDDNSNSTVNYGTTIALGQKLSNSLFTTSHTFNLTSLQNNTLYYYNLTVCNSDGFCNTSGTYSFLTNQTDDTIPPTISNRLNSTTNSSSTITFTSDKLAKKTIKYGTTTFLGLTNINNTLATSHSAIISGLSSNTTYYYNISICNADNYCLEYGPYTFTTLITQDTLAPVISNVNSGQISGSGATITWTTNEPATTVLKYGTVSGTYVTTLTNSTLTTSHSRTISSLSENTTYYFVVNSTDAASNSAQSSESNFITLDTTPPVISNIASGSITGTTASITWTTNEAANSQVRYGTISGIYTNSVSNAAYVTSHNLGLSSLSPDTTYYYVVISNDSSLNSVQSTVSSFTTQDTAPPVITFTSPINMTTTFSDLINIGLTVTTDEAAACYVDSYKIGSSVITTDAALTPVNSNNLSHSRSFTATAESSGFDFYFTVVCTDALSNSGSKTVYFAVDDTTAPTATFTADTPATNSYNDDNDVVIKFTTSESQPSGFPKVRFGSGSNSTVALSSGYYTYSVANLADGTYNFTVYVSDSYGNTRSYYNYFNIDTDAPRISDTYPEDDDIIKNCMEVVLNATLDEDGTCSYELFIYEETKYETCIEDCEDDKTDCKDDAETTTEKNECDDDYDDCEESCEDDKYKSKKDNDMELAYEIEDCVDDCEDVEDECRDTCKDTKSTCMESAIDSDDKNDCSDDYDDCLSDCSDDLNDCSDDCNDAEPIFTEKFDNDCFDDGEYLVTYTCEDLASNEAIENVTFTVDDTTPPKIIYTYPNSTINTNSFDIKVNTDEYATCKLSEKDTSFNLMNITMLGKTKFHTYAVKNLNNQDYNYYALCNDSAGNLMSISQKIAFSVDSSKATVTKSFNNVKAGNTVSFSIDKTSIPITKIDVTVNEEIADIKLDVRKILDIGSIKKPDHTTYELLEITKSGFSNKQVTKSIIEFKVEKTWLANNGKSADQIALLKYSTDWEELTTTKKTEDADYAYYSSETTGFSMFAIIAKEPVTTQTTKTTTDTNTDITNSNTQNSDTQDPTSTDIDSTIEEPKDISDTGKPSYLKWIIILLCVVVVGGGSVGFFVYKSHRHPQQNSFTETHMQPTQRAAAFEESNSNNASNANASLLNPELEAYLKQALENGQTPSQIANNLLNTGYTEADISSIFSEIGLLNNSNQTLNNTNSNSQNDSDLITNESNFNNQNDPNNFNQNDPNNYNQPVDNSNEEIDIEILRYIKDAIKSGQDPTEIKSQLLSVGHDSVYIDSIFAKIFGTSSINNNNNSENSSQGEDQEIISFVKQSIASGTSINEVYKQLLEVGHDPQYIKTLIKPYAPKSIINDSGNNNNDNNHQVSNNSNNFNYKPHVGDEITEYIKNAISQNIPRKVISDALISAGHNKKDIYKRFAEIDAAMNKLTKDIKLYIKTEKKNGKSKEQIKQSLLESGLPESTIKDFL